MKTSSSKSGSTVTHSSNIAAMPIPTQFSAIKMT